MNYGTFWQRLGALLIDFLILFVVSIPQMWLFDVSRSVALIILFPFTAIYAGYAIFCHAKYGPSARG
jgi:hypothetical protein